MNSELQVAPVTGGLRLFGVCDLGTAVRLDSALRAMERRRARWDLDLSLVVFADSGGLAPIAESVRRCRQLRRPELSVSSPSRCVRRVFDALGVAYDPFSLQSWDTSSITVGAPVPA